MDVIAQRSEANPRQRVHWYRRGALLTGQPHYVFQENGDVIYLVADLSGAPQQISETSDIADVADQGFTKDSKWALFSGNKGVVAWNVATGASTPLITSDFLFTAPRTYAVHGAAVVLTGPTTKQLLYRDVGATAAPTVMAEGVDDVGVTWGLMLTPVRDALAYLVSTGTGAHGLYAAPVPP